MPAPALSIIVPTLNEAAVIADALARLRAQAPGAEVIVADGGSGDGTPALAAPHARVLAAPRGRAHQMNRGARESRGAWLLFLHADTRLPHAFGDDIARAAARGYEAGAFRLRIAGRHPLLPLLSLGANLRTRWLRIALGDQAPFCTRALFERLGGFAPAPIMEDYLFSRRLRREGVALYLARGAAETSGRRWDERGFWRTWWQFRSFYWRFRLRHDPGALRGEYEDVR